MKDAIYAKQFIENTQKRNVKNDKTMIVETTNLTKAYKHTIATNNVSLKISKGEIYGFLGLNGAGKTTTMRMILGMIKPSHGSFKLFGSSNPKSDKVWDKVGYMIESTYAYPNLTVTENLKVYYQYHKLTDKQLIPQIIARLKLDKYADIRAK